MRSKRMHITSDMIGLSHTGANKRRGAANGQEINTHADDVRRDRKCIALGYMSVVVSVSELMGSQAYVFWLFSVATGSRSASNMSGAALFGCFISLQFDE